jgi:hypothetical protein
VPAGIQRLVMSRTDTPAFVQSRYLDVLIANPLATALSPIFARGVNVLRAVFLDPQVRELYLDWDRIAVSVVAAVRMLAGPDTDDPRLSELVGELCVRCEDFRHLWSRHEARPRLSGVARLDHPQVGPLELSYEKLGINGTDGQLFVIFHAEPGSDAAHALSLLRSLADTVGDPPDRTQMLHSIDVTEEDC